MSPVTQIQISTYWSVVGAVGLDACAGPCEGVVGSVTGGLFNLFVFLCVLFRSISTSGV